MSKLHTKWVSRRERDLWCIDFSGYNDDMIGLQREIDFAEDVIRNRPANSLLVAVDLNQTKISAPIASFFRRNTESTSIHKVAILGVSGLHHLWCTRIQHVTWPKQARFFDDYEQAKDWLVDESY